MSEIEVEVNLLDWNANEVESKLEMKDMKLPNKLYFIGWKK